MGPMTYVALLRGINVGGRSRVEMARLRNSFERAGMKGVRTYINSGNVIFRHAPIDVAALGETLERAVEDEFGFRVPVLVLDADRVAAIAAALPPEWANDASARCDVLLLWDGLEGADVVARAGIRPGIDEAVSVPGAVLWRVERANAGRSGLLKLMGTDAYRRMTVRNCTTLRALAALAVEADSEAV